MPERIVLRDGVRRVPAFDGKARGRRAAAERATERIEVFALNPPQSGKLCARRCSTAPRTWAAKTTPPSH